MILLLILTGHGFELINQKFQLHSGTIVGFDVLVQGGVEEFFV
jgi:hypothetical protein